MWAGFDFTDAYDEAAAHFPGGVLVEVGNFLGKSLVHLGHAAARSGKPFRVVGVDTCRGSGNEPHVGDVHGDAVRRGGGTFAGELHKNLIDCGCPGVMLLVADSEAAAELFPDASCAMVFIDAQHTYDAVTRDIRAWLPKVRPGGWLAGHDYAPPWDGVVKAVDDALGREAARWSHSCWKYEVK